MSISTGTHLPPLRRRQVSTRRPTNVSSTPTRVVAAGLSDAGVLRESNQDRLGIDCQRGLLVLADGVASTLQGELAADITVAQVQLHYAKMSGAIGGIVFRPGDLLEEGIHRSNQAIREVAIQGRTATTVVCMAFVKGGVHVAHVGDSRAYRFRQDRLQRLTRDHHLANAFEDELKQGTCHPDSPRSVEEIVKRLGLKHSRMHHVLTRSVGSEERVRVARGTYGRQPRDRFLLCSDGLTDMVSDGAIARIMKRYSRPEEACQALVDAANEAGGRDNISVIVAMGLD